MQREQQLKDSGLLGLISGGVSDLKCSGLQKQQRPRHLYSGMLWSQRKQEPDGFLNTKGSLRAGGIPGMWFECILVMFVYFGQKWDAASGRRIVNLTYTHRKCLWGALASSSRFFSTEALLSVHMDYWTVNTVKTYHQQQFIQKLCCQTRCRLDFAPCFSRQCDRGTFLNFCKLHFLPL